LATLEQQQEMEASTENWKAQLRALLGSCSPDARLAIVGVGQPMRADDYVGSYTAKAVLEATDGALPEGAYLFDAEDSVEFLVGALAKLKLRHVIFIDACEMGLPAGEASLLSVEETSYPFFTTHGIPLKVLAERLLSESQVWVLAIQPKETQFGEALSREVQLAASNISEFIIQSLMEGGQRIVD
jgi:hydrogenase maturation protease